MMMRVLGLLVGILFLSAPFFFTASYLDIARRDPQILLAQAMGILFVAYGVGGRTVLSKLLPSWTKSVKERAQTKQPLYESDFQQSLEQVTPRLYVTPVLIAINVIVFLAMAANGAGVLTPNPQVHVQWGSNYGPLTIFGQVWRLVTATFLHFGLLHLALNMWALYENGRIVERLYGHFYFLALYLFSGIAGSLTSVLVNPGVNSAGASGAIFGVIGALLAFTVIMHGSIPFAVRKAQRNSTLAFVVYALISGFITPGIDNGAHLGGLAGGFLAGLMLARPLDSERRKLGRARVVVAIVFVAFAGALVLVPPLIGWNDATTYLTRASFGASRGDLDWAIADATRAIESDPRFLQAYLVRGTVELDKGDLDKALSDSSRVLELDANSWAAYGLRAEVKWKSHDFDGAMADWSHALDIKPDESSLHNNIAWSFATAEQAAFRDGPRAVESALRACELSQWKNASHLDTLAAAYARIGDFPKAVEWQQKALADGNLTKKDGALKRLKLYQAGKAWPPD